MTYQDCKTLSNTIYKESKDVLLVVVAPKGTTMEIPAPSKAEKGHHQIMFNSDSGTPIDVFVCKEGKEPYKAEQAKMSH